MNKPEVYWLDNPFDFNAVTHYPIDQPLTIRQWLDDHGGEGRLNRLPTVCVYSGRELMRAEYDQPIDGPVCFVTLPTGGDSGTNPMAMIAMVALTVFTMGAGAVTLAGLTAGMGIGANTMMVMQMGIMMAGSMLINAVFPPPGLPNSATPSTGSPTYAMQAQGNAARLGSPIPVNYGRMRIYPDFAAAPYTEFESNEQYLYQLFCIGQGENRVSDIRLDNTPIDNFAEVTTEIVPPLGKVTLFHTAVVTAPEAGGQEMSKPVSLGPYTLNDQATEVSRIAVDVVFPGGLMGVNEDNGDEYTIRVHLQISAEAIDDAGEPTGEGASIFNNVISGCTRTAIRRTLAADVTPGRYRVTVQRHTGESPSNEVTHCSLGAIKGYLVDDNEYGDVTLLAMRVRASANLSDSASRLVNVLCERLIPVWSGQGWSLPQLTRNPSWAFADAVRSRYGGDFADREIDLEGLLYLAGLFDDREDRFDGRFDTEQSLWDALGKIGQVCRSGPVRQGNMIRLIRDQHIETPAQAFGMANMSDFSVDYVMHDDRTADAVKITYWDEARDYSETTVLCQLPDDTADNPQEVTLFGCTQYEQAWREGMYLAATNRERRQMVSWTTGLEGHIPTFGDLVIINHDLLGAGQQFGGVVLAKEGAVLTLSADVKLEGEHWYLILRDRHGQPSAPIAIEQGAPNQVRALDTLPYIEEDSTREPTHYLIGQGSKVSWPVKITAITPEADNKVAIAGCIESEFVHTVDEGKIPPPLPKPKPQPPGLKIEDLRATQGGTVGQPVIFLSWAMAVGADRYQIEYSTDGRATWQPAGSGQSFINQHEFTAEPGLITCRVAAVGAVRGDWASIDVNAGSDFDTPGKVQPVLAEPFTGNALKVRWDKEPAAAQYLVEVWSHGALVRSLYLDRAITEYQYHYRDAQQDAAGRTLTVKVSARNAEGVTGAAGELTATNPPPGIPDNVQVTGLLNTLMVQCTMNPDPDIRELRVYGEQQSGFTPSAGNLLAASANALLSVPVPVNTHWWVKLAWVDQWGATDLVFSGEFEAEAKQITETEIGPDSISTPMLKANSVAAGKVAADAISGREISAATTITAGSGAHQAGMNGASDTGSTELDNMRFWAGADQAQVENAPFQVLDDGSMKARNGDFAGVISAVDGTFQGRVSATTMTGSAISSTTITSTTIDGATMTGGVIIGSTIYTGQELYLCDPAGNGVTTYYAANPKIPVGCEPLIVSQEVVMDIPGWQTRQIVMPLYAASYNLGPIRTNRLRWNAIENNEIRIYTKALGSVDGDSWYTFQIVNPEDITDVWHKVGEFGFFKTYSQTHTATLANNLQWKADRQRHQYCLWQFQKSSAANYNATRATKTDGMMVVQIRNNDWQTLRTTITLPTIDNSMHP